MGWIMLYLLYAGLALTTFFILVNGFLNGGWKAKIDVVCSLALLGLLIAVFIIQGWKAGLIALVTVFLVAMAIRPLAGRFAAWSFAAASGTRGGHYAGLPPRELLRISNDIQAPADLEELMHEINRGRDRRGEAVARLFQFCQSKQDVRSVMERFGITHAAFDDLYGDLVRVGAGQWRGGHWVAASALAYPDTLTFLLEARKRGLSEQKTAYDLLMHFERGSPLDGRP